MVYPVRPELRRAPRRACLPRATKGHRFSSCHTPFTLFTPRFEGSVEGPSAVLRRSDVHSASRMAIRDIHTFQHSSSRPLLLKLFRTNTYEACPIMSALTPFKMNTSGSVHSKAFYPPLKSTLMKNRGVGCQLLLTRSRKMHSISADSRYQSSVVGAAVTGSEGGSLRLCG